MTDPELDICSGPKCFCLKPSKKRVLSSFVLTIQFWILSYHYRELFSFAIILHLKAGPFEELFITFTFLIVVTPKLQNLQAWRYVVFCNPQVHQMHEVVRKGFERPSWYGLPWGNLPRFTNVIRMVDTGPWIWSIQWHILVSHWVGHWTKWLDSLATVTQVPAQVVLAKEVTLLSCLQVSLEGNVDQPWCGERTSRVRTYHTSSTFDVYLWKLNPIILKQSCH